MAGQSPIKRRRTVAVDEELNIQPIMNLFLVLIPALMASITLVKVAQIDAPIPKVVDGPPQEEQQQKPKQPFELLVLLDPTGIVVKCNLLPEKQRVIPNLPGGNLDIAAFHDLLISIKSRAPDEKSFFIRPEDNVIYQHLIDVMDAARELEKDDPDIPGRPRGPDAPPSNWDLFPEAILEGVI